MFSLFFLSLSLKSIFEVKFIKSLSRKKFQECYFFQIDYDTTESYSRKSLSLSLELCGKYESSLRISQAIAVILIARTAYQET